MIRRLLDLVPRRLMALLVLTALTAPSPVSAALSGKELHVEGSQLTTRDGQRFIVKGVNMECFRDKGCAFVTSGQYHQRVHIARKLKELGCNAVRFNYRHAWLEETPGNLNQLLDFMESCAASGLYVMPSDHSYSGKKLDAHRQACDSFKAIVAGARNRGMDSWLLMNPYNEPGPCSRASWVTNMQDTLVCLRSQAAFPGVVVVDTPTWATDYDPTGMKQVLEHDATLRGGKPNVVFSHHWYPNIPLEKVRQTAIGSNSLPLLIGEIGQINPGRTGVKPEYVGEALGIVTQQGIPNGHNGVVAWLWNWCDQNSMTEGDFLTLNSYGRLISAMSWSANKPAAR